MADHIHRARRFLVRPAGVGLLTVLGVMMLVYGPALFAGVRGTTPSDPPMFPSRLAPYSWYTAMLSEGDMAAATLLYQNGYGVELYDDPQAVLLSSDGQRYRRLGVAESMSIATDQGDPAVSVLSPDGTFAVVGSADPTGSVEVVTLRDGSHRSVALGTASSGLPLAIGADGRSVVLAVSTASVDRYAEEQDLGLARLDLVTGTVRAYPDVRAVESAALSPDGTTLAVSGLRGVEIVDAATGAVRASLGMSGLHLDGDAWSPDGRRFVGVSDGEVVVVDVSTAQPSVRRIALTGWGDGSALGWRDESTVLVHGSTYGDANTSELLWIDIVTEQQTPFSSYAPGVTGAAFAEVDAARDLIPRWQVDQLPVGRGPLPAQVAAALALVAGVLAAIVTHIVWLVLDIPAQRRRSAGLQRRSSGAVAGSRRDDRHPRTGRSLPGGFILLAALGVGGVLLLYLIVGGPADTLPNRALIVTTAAAVVAPLTTVVMWAAKQWRQVAESATADQIDAAADRLAVRTVTTWSGELVRRGIEAPVPVSVRWHWADELVAVPGRELASSPASSSDPPALPAVPGDRIGEGRVLSSGVVTRLHDEVYARLQHGRLMIIGGAGAGKTAAMMLLLTQALAHREKVDATLRARVPVPVWLTLGSWDPFVLGLREWVTMTMERDHPYLRAVDFGSDVIGSLFDGGRIALFLDGLDEMPVAHRDRALELLETETRGLRVTLTCRPDQYRAAVDAGRRFASAAVIELYPVNASAAGRFLLADQVGSARQGWQEVATRLQAEPDGDFARALRTPLALSLTRSAYADRNPVDLLAFASTSERELRHHLLDQLLVTAYADPRERATARSWLSWIAREMNSSPGGPTRDLKWWEIPRWTHTRRRQLVGLILGAFTCVAGLAPAWVLPASGGSAVPGLVRILLPTAATVVGVIVTLAVSHSYLSGSDRNLRSPTRGIAERRPALRPLSVGLVAGLSSFLAATVVVVMFQDVELVWRFDWFFILRSAALVGLVIGLMFGLGLGRSIREPQGLRPRLPTRDEFRRGGPQIVLGALPAGLVALVIGLPFGLGEGSYLLVACLLVSVVVGLAMGVSLWLRNEVWSLPLGPEDDVTPVSVYRQDVTTGVNSALLVGFLGGGLVALLVGILSVTAGLLTGEGLEGVLTVLLMVVSGGVVGGLFAIIGGLRSGSAVLIWGAEAGMVLRGRPVRFLPLLEDARERQLLRQAGAVYQFRHAELQDRLADGDQNADGEAGPKTQPPSATAVAHG